MTALAKPSKTDRILTDAPDTVVAEFAVRYRRFLDPSGKPVAPLPPFAEDPETMNPIYRTMVLTRAFDARAVSLQRTGQLGTYASSLGQEACGVAVASAMHEDDVLVPTYREHGALHWRGVTPHELFMFWGGDERGLDYSSPRHDLPPAIPIASQTLHAAGVAKAMVVKGETLATVCFLGDGATSKGDFYEALNLAGVWQLPVVFFVVNNGWAISQRVDHQTAARTLAQKAFAAGIEGEQVDGNDVIAIRQAALEAVEKARNGGGPSLIELLTYRLSDHTTADDASRYRPDEEVSAAWANDPVARLRTYIGDRGWWSKENEEALLAETKETLDAAKEAYLSTPPQPLTEMFDFVYETTPAALESQRKIAEGETDA